MPDGAYLREFGKDGRSPLGAEEPARSPLYRRSRAGGSHHEGRGNGCFCRFGADIVRGFQCPQSQVEESLEWSHKLLSRTRSTFKQRAMEPC